MAMRVQEYDKMLIQMDFIKLNRDLNNYYESLESLPKQKDFIEYIELGFIIKQRLKVKDDTVKYGEGMANSFIFKSWVNGVNERIIFLEKWIKEKKDFFQLSNSKSKQSSIPKKPKLSAPVIRLFCEIINDSKVIVKIEDETAIDFCKRVCQAYNLKYTDNVRKYFSVKQVLKANDKNLKTLITELLPSIPIESKKELEKYIDKQLK